jgi:16S rRNA (cytidine1402-2'-O)-methyltransferase
MNKGKLVICPTPIGNLGDITLRALEELKSADIIYAEDTRRTAKLLSAYDISVPTQRLDEEVLARKTKALLLRISEGQKVLYCSDAGMPAVSDPGARLVRAAYDAGLDVEILPGPSAVVSAYVASGTTSPHYYFGGFFPRKQSERKNLLKELQNLSAALIFYESPRRVVGALQDIATAFPKRNVAVCRELTKRFEEVYRQDACAVAEEFMRRAKISPIKGEIVLVIGEATEEEKAAQSCAQEERAKKRAGELKKQATLSSKEMVALLQEEFDISRNCAYRMVVG